MATDERRREPDEQTALSIDPRALVGRWRLDRQLVDRRLGQRGSYYGQLVVTAADNSELDWYESGELHWGDGITPAFRRLRLCSSSVGWEMRFSDGRIFHPWLLGQDVVHHCGADLYRGIITADAARMIINWRIIGPRKNQEIDTIMDRAE